MKKYIKTAKGAVSTSIITVTGSGIVQQLGGSTAGLTSFSRMLPAAYNLSMGMNMIGDIRKLKIRRR